MLYIHTCAVKWIREQVCKISNDEHYPSISYLPRAVLCGILRETHNMNRSYHASTKKYTFAMPNGSVSGTVSVYDNLDLYLNVKTDKKTNGSIDCARNMRFSTELMSYVTNVVHPDMAEYVFVKDPKNVFPSNTSVGSVFFNDHIATAMINEYEDGASMQLFVSYYDRSLNFDDAMRLPTYKEGWKCMRMPENEECDRMLAFMMMTDVRFRRECCVFWGLDDLLLRHIVMLSLSGSKFYLNAREMLSFARQYKRKKMDVYKMS